MEPTFLHKDQYFKGQHKDETFVCFFRHHWIVLLREFIYFTVLLVLASLTLIEMERIQSIMQGNKEVQILFFMGFLMATIYIHRFFIRLLNYFVDIGIITDMRLIDHHKTLFFTDTLDSVDLAQIQNLEKAEEGILPSLLQYGDIKVFLTGSASVKTFNYVPNAKFHFRCINREREIRQTMLRRRGIEVVPHEDYGHIPTKNPDLID